jgi:TolA-binding protein
MMLSKIIILMTLFLTGCGFSSGLYKDILKAQDYISSQQYQKAVFMYKDILTKKPSKSIRIKINYQLGEINSIYLNQYKEAIGNFKEILKTTEDPLWHVKSMEKIGEISFENLKDYQAAANAYKKLISFEPILERNDYYNFRYAETLFYLEQFDESSKRFKLISVDNNNKFNAQTFYYLGLINFYQKKWDIAINYWFEHLKREKRKDKIVQTKFMIANAYESSEQLKEAYNIYYSIIGEYPNTDLIKQRLESLYKRRVARKR